MIIERNRHVAEVKSPIIASAVPKRGVQRWSLASVWTHGLSVTSPQGMQTGESQFHEGLG